MDTHLTEAAGALADAEVVVVAVTDGLIAKWLKHFSDDFSSCVLVIFQELFMDALRSPCAWFYIRV